MTKSNGINNRPSDGVNSWPVAIVVIHHKGHCNLNDQGNVSNYGSSLAAFMKGPDFWVTVTNDNNERGRNKHNSKITNQPWNIISNHM